MKSVKPAILGLFLLAVCGIVGVTILASGPPSASGQAANAALTSTSSALLREGGLEILVPAGSAAADKTLVPRETAIGVALGQWQGTIREVVLAEVTDQLATPATRCLCWVVSITPTEGFRPVSVPPWMKERAVIAASLEPYHLEFIDAHTGKWLFSATGAKRAAAP